ncbi:MAG: DUF1641 domain-containing protein [Methanosarcinaceae archaeon]|nr:DUF1641 domain-containing protein [Methanosarcinaceae archaeon]
MSEEIVKDEISGVVIEPEDMECFLELIKTVRMLQNYMDDQTAIGIAKVTSTMLKLTNIMMSTGMIDICERALQDPQLDKAILNPPRPGFFGMIKMMGDKDFQKGLGVMTELLKAMGRATEEE